MQVNKQEMIALLTGVKSSKRSYYTELKQTVEQLRRKNIQLEIINDVMKSIKVDMSLNEILRNVIEKLQAIMDCDRFSLYLKQNNKLVLTNIYPEEDQDLAIGFKIPKKQSLYWTALLNKQIIKQEIIEPDTDFFEKDYLIQLRVRSVIVLPIFIKKRGLGVLCIGRKKDSAWSKDDLLFLEQLTNHLAVSIENSQLYEEVVRAKQQWEDTFKAVADMIIVYDQNLQILQYNHSVRSFFHLNGNPPTFALLGDTCKKMVADTFQTKTPGYQDVYFHHASICEAYTFPVHNNQCEIYGVILYLKDVTEKRNMEAQLLHSVKLAAIGEMAAGIAHELNSPLTAILGNSQLLLRNKSNDDTTSLLLNDIKNCGDRSKRIIKSLLTFSRQDVYEFEPFCINEAIMQVFPLVKYQFENNGIHIRVELDDSLPKINGSQQQIEQIMVNLILNAKDALEASRNPSKELTIQTMLTTRDEVQLVVQDNGIGIEQPRLTEIFHPFYTTKAADKGTGLGLSVSLGIAKAHGGTIDVLSSVQEGSRFILRLPVQPSIKLEG